MKVNETLKKIAWIALLVLGLILVIAHIVNAAKVNMGTFVLGEVLAFIGLFFSLRSNFGTGLVKGVVITIVALVVFTVLAIFLSI